MSLLLFVNVFALFMFSSFAVTYQLTSVNKVVMYTPLSIFEISISTLNYEDDNNLHFDKDKLYLNLKKYYDESLDTVMKDYTLSLYFYNQNDGSICTSEQCDAVEVTVSGYVAFGFSYSRSVAYQISKGAMYGY